MNELIMTENINIEDLIYEIRGKQVMLDSDLAKLYHVETKRINEAVNRNKHKFPNRFSFVLTDEESKQLEVANCDLKLEKHGGRRYNIRVFTEQGVAMLATILKSKVAVEVSIRIMDVFVLMRKYLVNNNYNVRISNIETKLIDHDNKFEEIFDKLGKTINNHIFFEGQIYDAYSLMIDIFNKSNESIIIIDNYIDKTILDITNKTKKKITIITNKYNNQDFDKYKKQYNNIKIKINNNIHDRFIIIDRKIIYHCGTSFKDLGKKCFAINRIEDNEIISQILTKIV